MPWNDPSESFVAGTGQVYVGPVGTALPSSVTAGLNSAYIGLGFHTEDGVTQSNTPNIQDYNAWQSFYPIRLERQAEDFHLAFSLLQFNETNIPLAFGGGEVVSDGGSGYRYNPPVPGDAPDYRTVICDVVDGERGMRIVIKKGLAVEAVESQFSRQQMAALPLTIRAVAPDDGSEAWYELFDDAAAFAAGS